MKAIILDIDGTLWDTTELVAQSWNEAIAFCQVKDAPYITSQRLKQEFGKPMWEIAKNLFPMESEVRQKEIMDVCCEYEEAALDHSEVSYLFEGVKETIIALSKKTKLFIVSNCQDGYIPLFLKKNGLEEYILDYECSGKTGKPKGENIALIMERNELTKEQTVYVGDTQGDANASDVAGVPFLFVAYGFGKPDHYACKLHSFRELLTCEEVQ